MGNDAAFDTEVEFPSFSRGRVTKGVFKDVFNKFYGLEYLSEGKGIQCEKRRKKELPER